MPGPRPTAEEENGRLDLGKHGNLHLGIDLGGSKIEIIAIDANGAEVWRKRIPAPRTDYGQSLDAIESLVRECESRIGPADSIGIGIPGSLSLTSGRVRNAYSTPLLGQRFAEDIETRLGRGVTIANDADCFALSEALDGAAAGAATVFGVILGTGVGGGFVVGGRLLRGANAIAGEWGHNPLPWPRPDELPGPPCSCGQPGHIESWLSGTGFAASYVRAGASALDAPQIIERMRAGDSIARSCFDDYVGRLARSLATIINTVDPHVIVLGGGMSNVPEIYPRVPLQWRPYVYSDDVKTRLMPAHHGDSSGVRGAAWIAL